MIVEVSVRRNVSWVVCGCHDGLTGSDCLDSVPCPALFLDPSFLDPSSLKVLELEAGQPDDTAAEFHFGSIAHDNDATEHSLEQTLAAEDLNPEYNG